MEPVFRLRPASLENPPLLLLLHGYGSDESDLFGLAPYLDERLLIASLRAPRRYPPGYGWYDVAFTQAGIQVDEAHLPGSAEYVAEFLVRLAEKHPHRSVAILGFSQGAALALQLLLTSPERVDALIALSGHVPGVGWESRASDAALSGKPVFVGHGTRDLVVPIAAGRDAKEKLGSLPLNLTYREYPMAHEISGETLEDLLSWFSSVVSF
jgi:phospholipase/carboxylesterase